MESIQWIHLSDLHFGDSSTYSKKSRNSLLDFITKEIIDKHQRIDYIFVTGDVVYAKSLPTLEERCQAYQEAADYLKKLAGILWSGVDDLGFLKQHIFIVPGNHDVCRNESRTSAVDSLRKQYGEGGFDVLSSNLMKDAVQHMKDYFDFAEEFTLSVEGLRSGLHYVEKTDRINVLHINTCVTSGKDGDDGNLILGYAALENAMEELDESLPTIVLAHHNIDCLDWDEQKKVELLLKNHCVALYLCGHSHTYESNLILRYNQQILLTSFTCGTLMSGRNTGMHTVFLRGSMNCGAIQGGDANHYGNVYAYKFTEDYLWQKEMDYGMVIGEQNNCRPFRSGPLDRAPAGMIEDTGKKSGGSDGIPSVIVKHRSEHRASAFNEINKRAESSLSVYGIGITHVSKERELLSRILDAGGTVRLCMMDTSIFKSSKRSCLKVDSHNADSVSVIIKGCGIEELHFCVSEDHLNSYIRAEYAEDVRKSYARILQLRKEWPDKDLQIRVLKSFVPISINSVNERNEDVAELIAEYNMPFVERRLLLQVRKKQNKEYYEQLQNVFERIWDNSVEVDE